MSSFRIFSVSVHLINKFIKLKSIYTFTEKTCCRIFNSMSLIKNYMTIWRKHSRIIITSSAKTRFNISKQKMMIYNNQICTSCFFTNLHYKAFTKEGTLFTHAGIIETWWKKHFPDTPTDAASVCNALNDKMKNMETFGTFIDDALMEVSMMRGGEAEAGSCLWADLDEHRKSISLDGIYQVFGHTQQKKKAVIKKTYADLDCRKAFLISSCGEIKAIK